MLERPIVAWLRTAVPLWQDRRGVTAVEYGVMAALIVVVCLVAINNLGQVVLVSLYERISQSVAEATGTR